MDVCLIDDDPRLLATLRRGFTEQGHLCETFASSELGLQRILDTSQAPYDVLLLDVTMPALNGWELLAKIREQHVDVPTLFLTARQDVEDRVRGLDLGADDYIVKPFEFAELTARIRAVLRRHGHREPLVAGLLVIGRATATVTLDGRDVHVSAREHAFLELLASNPEQTFSRSDLLEQLWSIRFDPGTNVVDVLVARLRRKLGPRGAALIQTVVGTGYRMGAEAGEP